MPQIKFKKEIPPIDCVAGETLMNALLANNIPVASSCGGDGVCAKCKIIILQGNSFLNEPNPLEKKLILREGTSPHERFCCQVEVKGDLLIDAPYW